MIPDSTALTGLLSGLPDLHVSLLIFVGMTLVFIFVMYRARNDRHTLHAELNRLLGQNEFLQTRIDELEGRLEQCERLWARHGIALAN